MPKNFLGKIIFLSLDKLVFLVKTITFLIYRNHSRIFSERNLFPWNYDMSLIRKLPDLRHVGMITVYFILLKR